MCGDTVIVVTGEGDTGFFRPDGVVAVDPATGEEIWSAEGGVGQCRSGEVAVALDGEVTVHEGSTGEVVDELAIEEEDGVVVATPMADTVLVQQVAEGNLAHVALYARGGGEEVFSIDDVLASPVGPDNLLLLPFDRAGEHVLVRASDGEELAMVLDQRSLSNDCVAATTPSVLVTCLVGAPVVTAFAIDDGQRRWELDLSPMRVSSIAVIGDRVAVLTPDALSIRTAPDDGLQPPLRMRRTRSPERKNTLPKTRTLGASPPGEPGAGGQTDPPLWKRCPERRGVGGAAPT